MQIAETATLLRRLRIIRSSHAPDPSGATPAAALHLDSVNYLTLSIIHCTVALI